METVRIAVSRLVNGKIVYNRREEIKATLCFSFYGLNFYAHKSINERSEGLWVVTESKTGATVTKHPTKTKVAAVTVAKQRVRAQGCKEIRTMVRRWMVRNSTLLKVINKKTTGVWEL